MIFLDVLPLAPVKLGHHVREIAKNAVDLQMLQSPEIGFAINGIDKDFQALFLGVIHHGLIEEIAAEVHRKSGEGG